MQSTNSKQFVQGKSPAFNSGWESFFINRELGDNPHRANTEPHKDWHDGFVAAQSSSASK